MFWFIALLALVSCAIAGTVPSGNLAGRIVGGVETKIEQYPHQVSLQSRGNRHICGGSIYNDRIVITAAHCVVDWKVREFYVLLGSTKLSQRAGSVSVDVESMNIHPGYNRRTYINDIAILKLAKPVLESPKIKYISLANTTPKNGALAVVSGWGAKCFGNCPTEVDNLRKVEVNIVDRKTCGSIQYGYGKSIASNKVCATARNKDSCQGDSGGPLVSGNKLVGVVSWGNGCADSKYPGVYADIAYLRPWIESTIASILKALMRKLN